jgi:hypothetical protein
LEQLLEDIRDDNVYRIDNFIDYNETLKETLGEGQLMKLKHNLNTYFDNPEEKDKCLEEIKKILIQNRNVVSTFYEGLTGMKIQIPK